MKLTISILRQNDSNSPSYTQTIEYDVKDLQMSIAMLIDEINGRDDVKDTDGRDVFYIEWDCSCLQKKCGACAMLINGKPNLACDVKVCDIKDGKLSLAPLSKFPVIRDLAVDRSIMRENLLKMQAWLKEDSNLPKGQLEHSYESSRCLQCGCCLEVCPNFIPGEDFYSAAGAAVFSRIISETKKESNKEISKTYKKNIYNGCGKSLSCMDICPARIKMDELLVNSNAAAIWRRRLK